MRRWIVALLMVAGAALAAVWLVRTLRPPGAMTVLESQAMDMSAMQPPPGTMPVGTAKVEKGSIAGSVTYVGSVVAYGDQDVVARVTGRVEEIAVYPGERVLPGQLLVRLDSAELESRAREARAALDESESGVQARQAEWRSRQRQRQAAEPAVPMAQNEVREAAEMTRAAGQLLQAEEAEFARTRSLLKVGGASQQELEQDRAQLAEARARFNAARLRAQRAQLSVAQARAELQARGSEAESAGLQVEAARAATSVKQEELRTAEVLLGYTEIRATAPAEVVERVVSPGTLVSPGQVVLRLKQGGPARLQASLPAEQAVRVQAGFPVLARAGSKSYATRVSSVFRSADPKTRTMIVEARLPAAPELVPGAAVTMEIALEKPQTGLWVPLAAVHEDAEGRSYVWKVSAGPGTPGAVEYTCVMHPEVIRPAPGKCPKCGMQLVPKERRGATVARRQVVQLGPVQGERVAVHHGLEAGEEVVVQGSEPLVEGMVIAAVSWGENGPTELPTPATPASPGGHGGHGSSHSAEPRAAQEHRH